MTDSEVDSYAVNVYPDRSSIEPTPPVSLVKPLLEFLSKSFQVDRQGRVAEHADRIGFWDLDSLDGDVGLQDRLVFSTGLVFQMVATLRQEGYTVEVQDHREYDDRFEVDQKMVRRVSGEERENLAAVRTSPQGRIEVTNFKQTTEVMALIMRMYSNARFLIPVASYSQAGNVRMAIRKAVDHHVKLKQKGQPLPKGQCVIAPYAGLNSADGKDWDVILLPDALSATNEQGCRALGRISLNNTRLYGFVVSGPSPKSRRTSLRLDAITGPVIHRQLPELVGFQLLTIPTPSCPKAEGESGLALKKRLYCENDRRNDFVARVVKAFAQGDVARLRKYGVPVRNKTPMIRGGTEPRVAVLVESTVHAEELAKRLPGWAVQTRDHSQSDWFKYESRHGVISTMVGADRHGLAADVVILASGEATGISAPGFPPTMWSDDDMDLLVVDFIDEFDPEASRRFYRRRSECLRSGWQLEENKHGVNEIRCDPIW